LGREQWCGEWKGGRSVEVWVMGQRIRLDATADFEPSIALVSQPKYPTETIQGQIADLKEGESWWL
jgi:hypothetical protein